LLFKIDWEIMYGETEVTKAVLYKCKGRTKEFTTMDTSLLWQSGTEALSFLYCTNSHSYERWKAVKGTQ